MLHKAIRRAGVSAPNNNLPGRSLVQLGQRLRQHHRRNNLVWTGGDILLLRKSCGDFVRNGNILSTIPPAAPVHIAVR
jgi:hypothetical protein